MNNYKLNTLLKLRELEKEKAERSLEHARQELKAEQNKLANLEEALKKRRLDRTQMQDNFFHKALKSGSNKREVNCLAQKAQKNIYDESTLKNMLNNQVLQVKDAEIRQDQAHIQVIEANRDYKAISKHRELWQQQEKKREDLHIQNDTDDQNGARFWLKRRA